MKRPRQRNELLQAALAYAAHGWPVLPLRGKLPAIAKRDGGRGVHDATTDSETIRKWWDCLPSANIGIAMGEPSGVWALDIDPRHGGDKSMADLERRYAPLPQTIEQITGADGRHLLFRWSGEAIKNRANIAPGLDTRSTGGYIVAEPSRHPETGRPYTWKAGHRPNDRPATAAPDWLIELVADRPTRRSGPATSSCKMASTGSLEHYCEKTLAEECAAVTKAKPGDRNDALNKAAYSLGQLIGARALGQAQVEDALYDAAAANGLVADDGEHAVRATIASGIGAGIEQPRKIPHRQAYNDSGRVEGKPPNGRVAGAASGDGADSLILNPGAPLCIARKFLEERYSVDDLHTFHHHNEDFYAWNGKCYQRIDEAAVRAQIYLYLEGATKWDAKAKELVPFDPTTRKVNDVMDALRAAANLPNTTVAPMWSVDEHVPDLTHPPDQILACGNGLLHLPTLELQPHTPLFFSHNALDFDYDPAAGAAPPNWLNFLSSLWPTDQAAIETLQEIFGYLLTTNRSQQKIFMIVGPKRSGKGTIARVLAALLGQANVCAPTLTSLTHRFGLEPLIGILLAIIADARLGGRSDQAAIAERLLSISGEDAVTIDRKYHHAWTSILPTRFLILTNELPRIADASGALASRYIILTLTKSFYGKEDHGLIHRLLTELPAILNWAVEGWIRLRERGHFLQPASSDEAVQVVEDLASPISAFVRDRCTVEAGKEVSCDALFIAWQAWCEAQGRKPSGKSSFGRDLKAALPGIRIMQHQRVRFYEGLHLEDR